MQKHRAALVSRVEPLRARRVARAAGVFLFRWIGPARTRAAAAKLVPIGALAAVLTSASAAGAGEGAQLQDPDRVNGGASEYWVKKSGSDANSCEEAKNEATPKLTIAAALDCESSGDTIWIGDGTYAENITNLMEPGTSAENRTTIRAINRRQAIIQPSGSAPNALVIGSRPYVALIGLVIDARNCSSAGIKPESNSHSMLLDDIEVRNAGSQGLLVQQSPDGIVRNSRFHHNGGSDLDHGVYLNSGSDDWIVENNELDNNAQMGIQIYAAPKRTIFRNNYIHDNCQKTGSGSELFVAHEEHVIERNVIVVNGMCRTGITVNLQSPARSVLRNNTVVCLAGDCRNGISVGANAADTVLENNIAIGFEQNIKNDNTSTTLTTNLITGMMNDIWTSPTTQDLSLSAESAAIDAGTPNGLSSCGAGLDAGAFEVCGPKSASIDGHFIDVTFDTVAPPLQPLSGAVGWSVSCSGPGCGTPSVAAVTVLDDADNTVRLDITGLAGNDCSAEQTWTVSFDAAVGEVRDSARIGNVLNQSFHTFVDLAVANACSGPGGSEESGNGGDTGVDSDAGSDDSQADTGSISGGSGEGTNGGTDGSGGPGIDSDGSGGCSCSTPPRRAASWLFVLVAVMAARVRPRRSDLGPPSRAA